METREAHEVVVADSTPPVTVTPDEAGVPVEAEERRHEGLTPLSLLLVTFLAYLLYKVQVVIILLIVGILLATAISGPVEYLHKRRNTGRGAAILIVYLVVLTGLGALFYLLIPPVAREAAQFAQSLPALLTSWRNQLEASNSAIVRTATARLFEIINANTTGSSVPLPTGAALNVVQGIGGSIVTLFTIFLISFYWITEKPLIKRAVATIFRTSQRRRVLQLWNDVESKLGAWIRGQLILMAVVGILATTAYFLMGLPFWLVLGVIAGLTEAIPNVGPIIGAVPAVLVALTVDWRLALGVVAFVIVLQLLENAVLVPRIMRGAVGLTPLTTILAILAGGEFRGVVGALLAIPVAAAIQVILSDLLREKREREAEEEARPRGWFRRALHRSQSAVTTRTPPKSASPMPVEQRPD